MIIAIDDSLTEPIYLQIRNQIIRGISDGRLAPGEQLPTVRALATEMGINTMTVSKAYQTLKQEGYIQADRRSGAKVKECFPQLQKLSQPNQEKLRQIVSEAKLQGVSQEAFLQFCAELYGSNK